MTRRSFPIVLAFLLAAGSAVAMTGDRITPRQRQALGSFPQDVQVELDSRDVPAWLMGRLAARVSSDPVSAATEALDLHGAAFRRGADDSFAHRLHETDWQNETHVRMTQLYRGLPVVGGELIVHLTRDQVIGINGRFVADLDLDTRVALSPSQLAGAAEAYTAGQGGEGIGIVEVGETVVYAGNLDADARTAVRVLLQYRDSEGPQIDDVFVDAQSGAVLGTHPRVFRAKSRKIYNMNQACVSTGNEMPGTLMFSEGGSSSDTGAMGAYNGTGTTYDYYKARFNRDSYDNAGSTIVSSVHGQFSSGTSCSKNNAAWFDSPYNQMVYGDGDGTTFTQLALSLDVTGHELTHGVCYRSANLTYNKESGALNEANSDILGESVAFYNGTGDWKIGAEVYTPGTSGDALRYFANPTADGYSADYWPERLYSGTCTPSSSNDQCGVHGNSGIANLYYYLLCQGGTHPRSKTTTVVTGIGIAKGEQIWYKALTAYMTSSTNFAAARTATANAATALYGSCSAEYIAAQKAWDAVGVGGTWSCGTTYSISGNAGTTGATVSTTGASATSDASSNYTISGLAAGTYTVTPSKSGCTFSPTSQSVTITSASVIGKNFTASCTSGDTQLTSGVGVAGSVAASAWKYYYITVPSGATNLTFATTGATGDVDIYTQSGAKPTSTSYVCRPYTSSGNETCSATNPAAGTWWVGVYGYAAGSYTVTGTVTSGTVTYSISGSAGTSGATLTAGTKSATSDASNNYTITGLANGTYTVTPSKSGCTFSPTSQSVTVSGANVTGKNFTATCGGGATTLLTDGFENTGWATAQVSGTAGVWSFVTSGTYPTISVAHGGSYMAKFNSYTSASGSQTRISRTTTLAIPSSYTTVTLKFWMYHDTGYSTYADKVQPQVSTGTWTSVGSAIARYDGSTGWKQHSVDVSAYKGQTITIGFVGISAYGNNVYIDDLTVIAQ